MKIQSPPRRPSSLRSRDPHLSLPADRSSESVAIVGAGIVGLANAWAAAKQGLRVTVFERSPRASGGSIRNFGMVWPIGQPAGPCYQTSLRSRDAWMELIQEGVLWGNPYGSLHVAHRDDEWDVLQEFASLAPELGVKCELHTPSQVHARTPAIVPNGLRGGLFSPTEICVNPPQAIRALPGWLNTKFDVEFAFNTTVTHVDTGRVRTAAGETRNFDRIVICGGPDFETLFPELFAESGMKRCKLQMLKTLIQPDGWKLGCHIASGLTLRHYEIFKACRSLKALNDRVSAESPEIDRYGVHVMASQNDAGEVILGDSHEYDDAIEPFDKSEIDALILRELHKIITLPNWTIAERWHGVYAKTPGRPVFQADPLPDVHVMTGTGGAGMTMSFGLALEHWEKLFV
jgi:FAD dependent oxidoreductase TIGR03364